MEAALDPLMEEMTAVVDRVIRRHGESLLHERERFSSLRVLMAEDDRLFAQLVRAGIGKSCSFAHAETGRRALELYLAAPPDLLLLDLELGDLHGSFILRQVRRYDPGARVIIVSGNSHGQEVSAALANGAQGFIAKPFNLSMLRHHLEKTARLRNKVVDPSWI